MQKFSCNFPAKKPLKKKKKVKNQALKQGPKVIQLYSVLAFHISLA